MLSTSLALAFQNIVVPVMGSAMSLLLTWILLKTKQHMNIQIKNDTESFLRMKAEEAVQFVSETVAEQIKEASTLKFSKRHKLEAAISRIIDAMPEISEEDAEKYIYAAVARIEGEGATKKAIK